VRQPGEGPGGGVADIFKRKKKGRSNERQEELASHVVGDVVAVRLLRFAGKAGA